MRHLKRLPIWGLRSTSPAVAGHAWRAASIGRSSTAPDWCRVTGSPTCLGPGRSCQPVRGHIVVRLLTAVSSEWTGWHCHGVGGLVAEEHDENQLLRISVPSGDHSPGDLALSPVHA